MACGPDHAPSISGYMLQVLKEYDRLRGVTVTKSSFWDAVIISAADAEQQKAFEYQIDQKKLKGELPLGIPFWIISDPTGPAIGNGGSTLHVLDQMKARLKEKMDAMRLLLIHAGGSSKRLPTAAILGKLFTPLPLKYKPFQMLDLKLAMYLSFLKRMAPGVFVTCSDDIETYALTECAGEGDPSRWSFDQSGFTALAHESHIDTGEQHGVYVLPQVNSSEKIFTFGTCLEVLQKPSKDLMRKKQAIIHGSQVCTDSVFFFTHDVTAKLLQFYHKNHPLNCEVDAYHDFLQALGSRADRSYIRRGKNISDKLISLREQLFNLLNGTPLNILFLHKSHFYHLGTCSEYISNLSSDSFLFGELGMTPFVQSTATDRNGSEMQAEFGSNVTIMCSVVPSSLCCRKPVIIEYSHLEADMLIGENCLLSNCHVSAEAILHIPPCCIMHTAAVVLNDVSGFVTIAFGTHDDLKTTVSMVECGDLELFGCKLKTLTHIFNIQDLFTSGYEFSLWNGRFFSVCSTMSEAFQKTLWDIQAIHRLHDVPKQSTKIRRLSMAEVLEHKDIEQTLAFRDQLLLSTTKG